MKEISAKELHDLKQSGEDFALIDVREPGEYEFANISGKLIPMGQIPAEHENIPRDKKVVVMCRSGKRSSDIVRFLESEHGFDNLYNLKGGILAYSDDVDSSIPKY